MCLPVARYPPVPKYPPIAFYSAVRLGDPEQLAKIMDTDPYFITQDNGAGAPVHFATTYKQLDMVGAQGVFIRAYATPFMFDLTFNMLSPTIIAAASSTEQRGGSKSTR